ncbi:Nif3-like dinuclear metal center hexameric protein [Kribbella sandramycini]|uniref:GTP cyclohydrolase 1 type 2 homolog n=1 Tax=Kribbella sandramycini TaxID=60450 RepID=A0A841SC84_9ACTN|nr:dinuclear metal center YbgI/SA1388 family protein [Kribbella sandramycini]
MNPRLADVIAVLDRLYDPSWAESWDAVGLVTGDPDQPVRRILFAVDPMREVVDEAIAGSYDLLVTHHPLLLRGVNSVAATTPKGRVLHDLIRANTALHVCHTNADNANPGVSDALAQALGLTNLRPLNPLPTDPMDKLVAFVPVADAEKLVEALAAAGAGQGTHYDQAAWTAPSHRLGAAADAASGGEVRGAATSSAPSDGVPGREAADAAGAAGGGGPVAWASVGEMTFRPLDGSNPATGRVGHVSRVQEARVEMVLPRGKRRAVLGALRAAHPYEVPAYDLIELVAEPGDRGGGRIGVLEQPMDLREFAQRVADSLPRTQHGVRVAGDPARTIRTVAVVGGAGDSEFARVRAAGADAYVTADLRHHPATEAVAYGEGPALVDVAHWASEWPWLRDAERLLRDGLAAQGSTVETHISTLCTDAWNVRL